MRHPEETFVVQLLLPDGERTITARADEHIWEAAFAQGVRLPALCHQGWCLTCAAHLEAPGEVDQSDSATYYPEDRAAGFVLLCTGRAASPLKLRTHQAIAMRKYRKQKKLPAPYS
jgi:ferredoxin